MRRFVIALTALVASWAIATGYGVWLSTDRLEWSGPAAGVVTYSGFEQNKHASRWFESGRVREIWVLSPRDNVLVQEGILSRSFDANVTELQSAGVPLSRIRMVPADAEESDIPQLLRAIGQFAEDQRADQVVVECDAVETRFLRQIADAALSAPQSNRLRFIPLPHDEYAPNRWWACRTGWKDVYDVSSHIFANISLGPMSGFELTPWNPDEWESQTFPHLPQVSK